jgi:RNA polymerase sigma factor for flagellar operon FliA
MPPHISQEEMTSWGNHGLVKAAHMFNPESGSFDSYAIAKIRGAILDELRSQDWVPRSLRKRQREIGIAQSAIGLGASHAALAEYLGWPESDVTDTLTRVANAHHTNYDDAFTSNTPAAQETSAVMTSAADSVVAALQKLPVRFQAVLALTLFEGRSPRMAGKLLGIPLEEVERIQRMCFNQISLDVSGGLTREPT